ncbi:potassium channel family protein [Lentibacillus sp. Marseille-P4043]|uniref:potassium channel family protein n=1 Tax=Lentibacillus sp. Marseille-P4043 TaxID=2040293 RepID=UPI000D0B6D21|nr:potassium channel family protein [Lentibacillus sp. Marseille-P4043]
MHFFVKLGLNLIKMRNLTLFLSTVIFVALCTFIVYWLEPDNFESLLNSFYFVMTTFATVGYGDYSPITLSGKLFAVLMYLIGIGLLGVVIGKIIDAFTIFRRKKEEGKVDYTKENHIIIIGWGKKTESAVREILNSNFSVEVVIIDTLPKSPIDIASDRVHYVQGDLSEEETFEKANIAKAKSVIIFSDDNIQDPSLRDARTLTIAIIVERLAPMVHTTVEILIEKHVSNFSHVKVDEFILSQETISSLAVRSAMYKGVTKVYSQLISRQHGEDLFKLTKQEKWVTYQDAFHDLLDQGATLIADHEQLDINRRLNEKIPDDAELYVICNKETYQKIV